MRIDKLGVSKRAVVILGAGASRGAKCFEASLLPAPLDADFFAIMQRVQHKDATLGQFLEFLRTEFGDDARPRMEELFTQLEALEEFHTTLKVARGPRVRRYGEQLTRFAEITAAFFRHLFLEDSGAHRRCEYHESLAKALNAADTVISFNYDCLMDSALAAHSGGSWSATDGYGLNIVSGAQHWDSKRPRRGKRPAQPIRLLKLHGSLNWDRSAPISGAAPGSIGLRQDPYEVTARNRDEIVPPVWAKTIGGDAVFRELWKEARRVLPTGPVLVVVGYSVPPTDLLSQALIRVASAERAKNQKLSHLIVVNPDARARGQLIDLVKAGLSRDTTTVELGGVCELSQLLGT